MKTEGGKWAVHVRRTVADLLFYIENPSVMRFVFTPVRLHSKLLDGNRTLIVSQNITEMEEFLV